MQATARWGYEAGWLSGLRFDTIFIVGVLALALMSGTIVLMRPDLLMAVVFLDLWFLGYHHVISTYTKLAGTPADRQENKFLIYHLPFLVVAGVALLAYTLGVWSIITIYFFWQWYHYVRQSYGVTSFYKRKAKNPIEENYYVVLATLWCVPITGVLYRCSQGWDQFLHMPVWMPPVPYEVFLVSALVSTGLILNWVYTRINALRQGRLLLGQTLFMMSHFTAFTVGYILIKDITIGWLVANIWHNAQYILFVWLYNTKRFGSPQSAEDQSSLLAWACHNKPERILFYFTGCLLATTIFYKSIMGGIDFVVGDNAILLTTMYVVSFQTINFHHYIVDSMIWKARNKKHQAVMKLNQTT